MTQGAFFDPRLAAYAKRTVLPADNIEEVVEVLNTAQGTKAQWYNNGPNGGYVIYEK